MGNQQGGWLRYTRGQNKLTVSLASSDEAEETWVVGLRRMLNDGEVLGRPHWRGVFELNIRKESASGGPWGRLFALSQMIYLYFRWERSIVPFSSLLSLAMMNTMTKRTPGRRGLISSYTQQPIIRETKAGSQALQKSGVWNWRWDCGGMLLTGCSPSSFSATFSIHLRTNFLG